MRRRDTIVAPATGPGGAIAVVRVSGGDAIPMVDTLFAARSGVRLTEAAGYTVHFGEMREWGPCDSKSDSATGSEIVDEVLVTVFRAPHSYTGEDSVEISCHGSTYIVGRIMQLLVASGARTAEPGEFTVRAFLAGRLDLSQAEAVADLIASQDGAQHRLALDQMKGGISSALATLRSELVELASLVELELDFGEENVRFASREHLGSLALKISSELDSLAGSFRLGNAIREGIPVAIVGRPNAGKSTLMNALVGDDRAMVSDIPGTTRDRIEERVNIDGVGYRLIDTAGLRSTEDVLERMGIDRALEAVRGARIVLLVVDAADLDVVDAAEVADLDVAAIGTSGSSVAADFSGARGPGALAVRIADLALRPDQQLCVVVNKTDSVPVLSMPALSSSLPPVIAPEPCDPDPDPDRDRDGRPTAPAPKFICISAKTGENLSALTDWLSSAVDRGALATGGTVVSNARHHEALVRSRDAIEAVLNGISSGLSSDLLAEELREVLHHLGTITGEVTTDEMLGTIFSKFCIGK